MTGDEIKRTFNTLRSLLFGPNVNTLHLKDADVLLLAVSKLESSLAEIDHYAWRNVATQPPPLRIDVLFANDSQTWVGQAREVTYSSGHADAVTEIAYFYDGDLSGGDPPIVWAHLPLRGDPTALG